MQKSPRLLAQAQSTPTRIQSWSWTNCGPGSSMRSRSAVTAPLPKYATFSKVSINSWKISCWGTQLRFFLQRFVMKVMIDETTYEGSGASKKLAKQVIFMKSSQTCSANLYACYDSCLLTVVFNDGFWWFDRPVLELHWLAFTNTPLHPTSHLDPETKNSKTLFQVDLKTFYRQIF